MRDNQVNDHRYSQEVAMSSNSGQIVHQLQQDFQEMVEYVSNAESQTRTAYEVELSLFRSLMALGAKLLYLFFVQRASIRPQEPVYAPKGSQLIYQGQRRTTYYSVFGKIRFQRHYYHAVGQGGTCPLDAALSLPPRCYSDLLRDWAEYCTTTESYDESNQVLERILGLSISKLALETGVLEDAVDVDAFYEQKAVPSPWEEGSILVAQADGKGVPMVRQEPAPQHARRGKGAKRTKKKEAVVTVIYTIEPYFRTPQEVADALLRELEGDEAPSAGDSRPERPVPVGKETRATLAGKDIAFERLAQRVSQREGAHVQHRVALTDGAEPLQRQVQHRLSRFTLVLDIIHVSEYLWDAANALLGEKHPERTNWVKEQLLLILSSKTTEVIQTLERHAQDTSLSAAQCQVINTTIGYYQRNLPYMHYDHYLANGWPIGTGVVEGACGHLVKDRMERSGMRWTLSGAQALLDLRAVRTNDDWDAYQAFHRLEQHQRLYHQPCNPIPAPELFSLNQSAPATEMLS
jgi:hypothetical protein